MKTHCSVPAKLILSGEHAVLYQCPALSMAVDLSTHCWAEYEYHPNSSVTIDLVNFNQTHHFPYAVWQAMAIETETRFHLFEQQIGAIQSVLTQPVDLILNTLYHFEELSALKPGTWSFKIESDAPIGRGLGSSAAVILSLLTSLIKHHDLAISNQSLLALAQKIECRQHGKSSGIDPATMIYGGLLKYQINQPIQKMTAQPLQGWLIDTGKPTSTTGQCVEYVKQRYAHDTTRWQTFATISQQIATACRTDNITLLRQGIRHNQQLLAELGVVPEEIQQFIHSLEHEYNAAAKVCGAGSVTGSHAGMILCISEQSPEALCAKYNYECRPLTVQMNGIVCNTLTELSG